MVKYRNAWYGQVLKCIICMVKSLDASYSQVLQGNGNWILPFLKNPPWEAVISGSMKSPASSGGSTWSSLFFISAKLVKWMIWDKKTKTFSNHSPNDKLINALITIQFIYNNHDQLKLRPYFLPWVSKNRRYVSTIQSLFWILFTWILLFFNLKFDFSLLKIEIEIWKKNHVTR